jgi:hypothetical protein
MKERVSNQHLRSITNKMDPVVFGVLPRDSFADYHSNQ